MKRTRKGFTLIELLVVIGVIGILSAMTVMGGPEMNNIATANKIVRELNVISSAMNMYYADNRATAGTAAATAIKTAITDYIKSGAVAYILDASGEDNVGKYLITVHTDKSWWLTYTLPAVDTDIGKILKNKAKQEGFVTDVGGTTEYAGAATVCMKVR